MTDEESQEYTPSVEELSPLPEEEGSFSCFQVPCPPWASFPVVQGDSEDE